jgi:hypothetical protein
MNEARQFLRYIIPGILLGTEVLILLYFLRPDVVRDQLKAAKSSEGLGITVAALLASGGVGFLLSTLHHTIHWQRWWPGAACVDHSLNIKELVAKQVLSVRNISTDEPIPSSHITRENAWIIVTALWHSRAETSELVKGAIRGAAGLTDLVHSTGTALVAALAAPIIAFGWAAVNSDLTWEPRPVLGFLTACAITCLMITLAWMNYRRTSHFAEAVIDQVITDALVAERNGIESAQITTYISPTVLRRVSRRTGARETRLMDGASDETDILRPM